ncbi:MAG: histidine kinase [Caulobacteraceae bacterium]|nr:histidine kinase [Caulobacteraceae bacterium]
MQASRASNGEDACRIFGQEAFDLILMDVNMPVMDGLTATRTIRSLEAQRRLPRTPIIMLTANGRPEHIEAGMAAGADHHVAKPIQITGLLEAVHQVLGRKWAV